MLRQYESFAALTSGTAVSSESRGRLLAGTESQRPGRMESCRGWSARGVWTGVGHGHLAKSTRYFSPCNQCWRRTRGGGMPYHRSRGKFPALVRDGPGRARRKVGLILNNNHNKQPVKAISCSLSTTTIQVLCFSKKIVFLFFWFS